MDTRTTFLTFFVGLFALTAAFSGQVDLSTCTGTAVYRIVFRNLLTPKNFGDLIPSSGLIYSPLAAVSHSNRVSFLTVRGFASREVEAIAETGQNRMFIQKAELLRKFKLGVLSVVDAGRNTSPGGITAVKLVVDCKNPFVTVLGIIAPSPDWIVQISNMNLYDSTNKKFVERVSGNLIAYDTGVDDNRDFTDDSDLSLDMPTSPQQNIAPLSEDLTHRFEGRTVGKYLIRRIK